LSGCPSAIDFELKMKSLFIECVLPGMLTSSRESRIRMRAHAKRDAPRMMAVHLGHLLTGSMVSTPTPRERRQVPGHEFGRISSLGGPTQKPVSRLGGRWFNGPS
jgi:hypothetical protein